MAFYFRKLGRSFRLVPATKSFGYSSRINEGDKKDDGSFCQRHVQTISGLQGDTANSPLPPSSLVPLSVRDMALVLLPRLEVQENGRLPSHTPESVMNVAKAVSFTADDILSESLYPSHFDKSLILERIVYDMRHPDLNRTDRIISGDDTHCQASKPPVIQVHGSCTFADEVLQTDHIFETLFMNSGCGSEIPALRGFSFYSSVEDKKEKPSKKAKDGPSADQLHAVKRKLEKAITLMFATRHDYSILHPDIVLENNLFGDEIVKRGLTSYALELMKLRLKINTRFCSTSMEVLNTTVNEESGMIRIHWRLSGLPLTEMLKFWRAFQEKEMFVKDDYQWFEAFSYFYIGKDGLVRKHRIDRMLPGSEQMDKLPSKLRKLLNRAKPMVT